MSRYEICGGGCGGAVRFQGVEAKVTLNNPEHHIFFKIHDHR
jgi:hypothetical protein